MSREEEVVLNPPEVATKGRIELNLHSGAILVDQQGIDFGDQEIEAFMAEMLMGQRPIDSRWPNRVITIPLLIGATGDFDAARIALQAEVGRINEEGGWLRRRIIGGDYGEAGKHLFADLVKATLKLGGGTLPASEGFDPNAELILEALPDFYGDEIVEAAFEGTGDASTTILTKGNLPGRVTSLTVTDKSGNDQLGLGWHFRCRNYSSAETAKWAYEAEAMTPLDAAAEVELTGASGGKAVLHSNLSTSWTPVLSTNLRAGSFLTHKGLYDVWARVYSTSSTPPWLRLLYDIGDLVAPSENRQVQVPGKEAFYLVNLGQINLQAVPFGEQRWEGIVQAYGASGGENISIDRLYFFCGDESSGTPQAPLSFQTPAAGYKARDEFNQAEANLNEQPLNATGVVSGPKSPGTVEDNAGTGSSSWATPANAKASDNAYAEVAMASGESHYLKATNMGFSIPELATIAGIAVTVERSKSSADPNVCGFLDSRASLLKAGVVQAINKASGSGWTTVDTISSYGSGGDLWGTTWTPAQLNASNFGFVLAVKATGTTKINTARVDAITVTVYYTEAGTTKWATSGDATDLKIISASHNVQRSEVSDTTINQGRYAIAGTATFTNIIAGVKCKREASEAAASEEIRQGALIRYTNEENWLMGCFDFVNAASPGEDSLRILKRKAGAVTELLKLPLTASTLWRQVWIEANAQGRILLWAQLAENGSPELLGVLFDTDLATGGTLASGKVGFYDAKTGAKTNTRQYDNFAAWVPSHDAVIFGSKNARLASTGIYRQSEDGKSYGSIARPGADLPRLPVSGSEERPVEIALRPGRGVFGETPDAGLDPTAAQLAYRPCYSGVPSS